MTITFWIIAACMLLLALAFVLLPLLRHQQQGAVDLRRQLNIQVRKEHLQELQRDFEQQDISEEEFNSVKQELEAGLLTDISHGEEDRQQAQASSLLQTIVPLALALPLFVILTYLALGDINMLDPQTQAPAQHASQADIESIAAMVGNLAARLQAQPDDGEGWLMLARSYLVLNEPGKAVDAYRNARIYNGDQPRLLANYAQALILANDNRISAEAEDLVRLALEQNPDEPSALWIAGYAGIEKGDLDTTIHYWEKLLAVLPTGSEEAASLKQNIDQLRQGASEMAVTDEKPAITGETIAAKSEPRTIDVQVKLADTLVKDTSPDDVVFIFARAAEGPRMPLAIARKQVKDLPLTVTLNDAMAMTPAMSLSKFKQVVVGARISKTGDAMPQSGDLNGSSKIIHLDEVAGVKITIDQVLP